jgi:KDO2-lipid IV(A) lauroyltransferase
MSMLFWFRFLSHWPLAGLHLLGAIAGWLAWGLSPAYRRRFVSNVRQAGLGLGVCWPAIAHAGRMSAELPRLWLGAPVNVRWENPEAVEQAYAARQGVLFLTPHLGCFEITAQAVARRFAAGHGPLTVLYRPARQPALAEVMALARQRPGLQAVPTTLAGVRQMIKALRAGQAVGLLPDQVPPEGMGLWAPFFGKPAYTMTLAARLALQTGARVVLIWGERLSWGQGYRLHSRALSGLPGELEAAVQCINQAMEALVLSCPEQYLWGYARYKAPRQEH